MLTDVTNRAGHRNAYRRYLDSVFEPNDFVIWRYTTVAELRTIRIAVALITPQCHFLLRHTYQNSSGAGHHKTLLDIVVRLGYTELSQELVAQGCHCTLDTIPFYPSLEKTDRVDTWE